MTFPNEKSEIRAQEIEKTKAEIKVLEAKLSFLEEMERHKSPAEEAYKRWWGEYPGTETWTVYDETRWVGFQKGYNDAYEKKVGVDKPSMTNCVLTGNPPDGYVAWNEWYGEMGSKGILHNLEISSRGILHTLEISSKEYQPTAQTPEETEKGLKDAMQTAKQNGVFDEQEPETLTLKKLLTKWEIDFTAKWAKNRNSELYEEELERFIQMFEEWLPDAIRDVQDDWDDGYNSYRNTLMRKLK
jgi:hypothetical protein